jgi:CubicO group peptidase (beta-lactamase class C family)
MSLDSDAIDRVFENAIATNAVPGAVAVTANRAGITYAKAFGLHDVSTGEPMRTDSVQRIASMTKLATSIALLQLVERSKLQLDTPVGDVLPAYDQLQVLEGFDGDVPLFRQPSRRGTILQLLTHTSGLAYPMWNAKLTRLAEVHDVPPLGSGLRRAFETPLVCDPGTEFNYGMGMDWVGLVIEAVSGLSFETYLEENLFRPLGLGDTVVRRSPEQVARSGSVHVRLEAGKWLAIAADYYMPGVDRPEFYAGGHSLYSTPLEFLRIQSAILNGGEHASHRLLRPETVDAMFENQIGALEVGTIATADPPASLDVPLAGFKWGLGIMVNTEQRPKGRSAGSGGWAGGFNTFYWIDRSKDLTAAMYTQTLPFYDPGVIECYEAFEAALYA